MKPMPKVLLSLSMQHFMQSNCNYGRCALHGAVMGAFHPLLSSFSSFFRFSVWNRNFMFCRAIPRQRLSAAITVQHILSIQYRIANWTITPLPVRSMFIHQLGNSFLYASFDIQKFRACYPWFFSRIPAIHSQVSPEVFDKPCSFCSYGT